MNALRATIAALGIATLAACGSGTSHPAETGELSAVGTVTSVTAEHEVSLVFSPDQGYEYYEGTTLVVERDDAVVNSAGAVIDPGEVEVGDRIEVWVDACMESFPVQCPDPSIRVLD